MFTFPFYLLRVLDDAAVKTDVRFILVLGYTSPYGYSLNECYMLVYVGTPHFLSKSSIRQLGTLRVRTSSTQKQQSRLKGLRDVFTSLLSIKHSRIIRENTKRNNLFQVFFDRRLRNSHHLNTRNRSSGTHEKGYFCEILYLN